MCGLVVWESCVANRLECVVCDDEMYVGWGFRTCEEDDGEWEREVMICSRMEQRRT